MLLFADLFFLKALSFMEISIVSVNWNAYEFAKILIESVDIYSSGIDYEIIIIDNSIEKQPLHYNRVKVLPQNTNIGHGQGLNIGISEAKAPYTFFLDIDCHILQRGWYKSFLNAIKGYQVLGGRGVPQKPIRPSCMLMETNLGRKYDFRDTPGYKGHRITPDGFDVAVKAYYDMLLNNVKIKFIDSKPSRYKVLNGEEWYIENTPYIYHHWHGSHLEERQVDFPHNDLISDRNALFKQIPWRKIF